MRKVSSETGNFLLKPRASVSHQLFIAPVPQFVAMRESTWNAVACGFDNMLIDGFGLQWRQFAVPVNNFAIAADCSHDFILVPVHQHQIKDRELRQIQRRLTSQPTVTYVTTRACKLFYGNGNQGRCRRDVDFRGFSLPTLQCSMQNSQVERCSDGFGMRGQDVDCERF